MLHHSFTRPNGQPYCATYYDETRHWLCAEWQGFVTAADGERGAQQLLRLLADTHAAYLLNDNSRVVGPWFDSVEWLRRVWAPHAVQLGLRYVAHVFQPHNEAHAVSFLQSQLPFQELFELQLFATRAEATDWLQFCQERDVRRQAPRA